jgi:hypothetical protein
MELVAISSSRFSPLIWNPGACEGQCASWLADGVEPLDRAAVVVLVVAAHQLLRDAVQLAGSMGKGRMVWSMGFSFISQQRIGEQADQGSHHDDRGLGHLLEFPQDSAVPMARAAVTQSVIERWPSTMTAPVIAPMAAAVTPSTKATMPGCLPCFLKYGAGMMVKQVAGQEGRRAATTAPQKPLTR